MAQSIKKDECTYTSSSASAAAEEEAEAELAEMTDAKSLSLPKRHVGRAARRRRRKWREIRLLEDSLRSGIVVVPVVLPVDRDLVSPTVLKLRTLAEWNAQADGIALQSQLGYIPGNAIRIVARVRDAAQVLCMKDNDRVVPDAGEPVILQLYPLVWRDAPSSKTSRKRTLQPFKEETVATDALKPLFNQQQPIMEPFPTLYWLTHPLLRCLVSKLELDGFGIELEQRLQQDSSAMNMMRQAHAAYGQERWNLLSLKDQQIIQSKQWDGALSPHRGVAGIRNCGAVKCLHAHLAHYLSQGPGGSCNRVGQWVWEELVARNKTR